MGYTDVPLKWEFHPQHPIQLTSGNRPFRCDGCERPGLPGLTIWYECTDKDCGKTFHRECVDAKRITWNSCSKDCHFILKASQKAQQPNSCVYRICDVCCSEIQGMFYECSNKKHTPHFIHPLCIKLPNRIQINGLPLELKGIKSTVGWLSREGDKCDHCNHRHAFKGMKGWYYVSPTGHLTLHVKCIVDYYMGNREAHMLMLEMGSTSSSSGSMAAITQGWSSPDRMIAGGPTTSTATADDMNLLTSGTGQVLVLSGGGRGNTTGPLQIDINGTGNIATLLKTALPSIIPAIFGAVV